MVPGDPSNSADVVLPPDDAAVRRCGGGGEEVSGDGTRGSGSALCSGSDAGEELDESEKVGQDML